LTARPPANAMESPRIVDVREAGEAVDMFISVSIRAAMGKATGATVGAGVVTPVVSPMEENEARGGTSASTASIWIEERLTKLLEVVSPSQLPRQQ